MFDTSKIKFFCFSLVVVLASCNCAGAITIEISPADRGTISFGELSPDGYRELLPDPEYWHALVVKNSTGPWEVSVSSDGILRSGAEWIPKESFKWASYYAGSKDAPYDSYTDGLIPGAYRTFVESGEPIFKSINSAKLVAAGHITTTNGAEIQLKYSLSIPDNQLAGDYTTRITYTVTQ